MASSYCLRTWLSNFAITIFLLCQFTVAALPNTFPVNTTEAIGSASLEATPYRSELEPEIGRILNQSPIVVFSKSYCPFCKRAKHLLSEIYHIEPAPTVVELDHYAMGGDIQAWLGKNTGRKTVPNIVVNGKSIGGCDDLYRLHREGKLEDTVREAAGDIEDIYIVKATSKSGAAGF